MGKAPSSSDENCSVSVSRTTGNGRGGDASPPLAETDFFDTAGCLKAAVAVCNLFNTSRTEDRDVLGRFNEDGRYAEVATDERPGSREDLSVELDGMEVTDFEATDPISLDAAK